MSELAKYYKNGKYVPQNNQYTQSGVNGYYTDVNDMDYGMDDYGYGSSSGQSDNYDWFKETGLKTPTVGLDTSDGGLASQWSGKDMFGAGFGIAQTGLGIANYFSNKKMQKKQMEGIDQNIASSKYNVQRHKDFVGNTQQSFG